MAANPARTAISAALLLVLVGATGYVLYTKYGHAVRAGAVTLCNTGDRPVHVDVGSGEVVLAPGATREVTLRSGAVVEAWTDGPREGGTARWTIDEPSRTVELRVIEGQIEIAGDGLRLRNTPE
ncbi:MAG: hypothetical protein SFY69_09025 [Planctomycetota bacterium]|nr:hypothetical protein [Planctomycetota bacterium]